MAIAGLILGIVALAISFVPCVGLFAIVPAVVGIILSAVGLSKFNKTGEGSKGQAVAGLVLGVVAIVVALIWTLVIAASAQGAMNEIGNDFEEFGRQMEEMQEAGQEAAEEAAEEAAANMPDTE